jgi:para-nitrobenzyl esterase
VIPNDPAVLFASGKFHHVPVIIGTNADEGTVSLFAPRVSNLDQATTWLRTTYGDDAEPKLAALYGITDDSNARNGAIKLSGDALFLMGARAMLRAASQQQANVYQYEFTRVSGIGRRTRWGAMHGSDLGYTFGTLPDSLFSIMGLPTQPDDYVAVDEQLSHAMQGAIVQFAKTGNQNGPSLPKWPSFRDGEKYLEYGDAIVVKDTLRSAKLNALDEVFARRRKR